MRCRSPGKFTISLSQFKVIQSTAVRRQSCLGPRNYLKVQCHRNSAIYKVIILTSHLCDCTAKMMCLGLCNSSQWSSTTSKRECVPFNRFTAEDRKLFPHLQWNWNRKEFFFKELHNGRLNSSTVSLGNCFRFDFTGDVTDSESSQSDESDELDSSSEREPAGAFTIRSGAARNLNQQFGMALPNLQCMQ